ncbi:helix-turn-helix transcriptional regulator [Uruburuella suis]|jgi:transcriptional regulator with XRE-family HTH domain|uniref:helix-turn-helix transcriptional regulator n=1 Tax=Uruburuella suis TaxID=252130 RepID=UPI001B74C616|nr:helix-turn-helix transcriptional regulator [Uruburuella suis]MBP7810696.1 helix-turn-helix transcriptional regulator [Neisseria sp.]
MNLIKQNRERKQLSQAELAEKVGCTQTYISYLERSQKAASPTVAKKIADVLDIDVLKILYPEATD